MPSTRWRPAARLILAATTAFADSLLANADEPGDAIEIDPVSVVANRFEPLNSAFSPRIELSPTRNATATAPRDLSELLGDDPAFAAYRRTGSVAAHPTTQGVRLRNLGANATSRALVLHDGVPQNDPFGGWVYWHQYNLAQLESVAISPSGAGESWGNFGAGGLISLISSSRRGPATQASLGLGTAGLAQLDLSHTEPFSQTVDLDLGTRLFRTDGFDTLRDDQQGPVDQPASSRSESLSARLRWQPNPEWNLQFSASGFQERRNNGTALARNDTRSLNLSALAQRKLGEDARLSLVAYRQEQSFRNVFSSVADDRASETPALDQYDVPATASGVSIVYRRDLTDRAFVQFGGDVRLVEGSVSERFRNLGDGFTRDRYAGGEQRFLGAFATIASAIDATNTLSATVRWDDAQTTDGARRETDLTNGNVLLDQRYADLTSQPFSFSARWRHDFRETVAGYLSVFRGFRAPTLNELYRPYRVRNDIVEANPLLDNERQTGIEYAIVAQPNPDTSLRLSTFAYRLDDMIANVLVSTEAGFDPRFGFIPAGGTGTLRENLDRSRVVGFEAQSRFAISESVMVDLSIVYSHTEVTRDEVYPDLAGLPFPQSSAWRANAGLEWTLDSDWSLAAQAYYASNAQEELGDPTKLDAFVATDLELRYRLSEYTSLALTAENVFDEQIVTGIAGNGLVSIGAPRSLRLTWTWRN